MNVNTEQDREEENCQDESMFSSIMFFFVLFCSPFRSFLFRFVPFRSVSFRSRLCFRSILLTQIWLQIVVEWQRYVYLYILYSSLALNKKLNSRPYNSELASIQLWTRVHTTLKTSSYYNTVNDILRIQTHTRTPYSLRHCEAKHSPTSVQDTCLKQLPIHKCMNTELVYVVHT